MSAPLVAHLIETPGPGGAETIVAELVARVDRARFRQRAIIPDSTGWLARTISSTDSLVLAPTPTSESGPVDLAYARGLRRIIRAVRPAVLHAHSFDAAFYAALAALGLPVRVIATFHGATDLDRTGWKSRLKWALVERSDALVCVSDALKARHEVRADRRGGRMTVIHNGVDFDCFTPGTSTALRRALDLPADTLLVGAVGNVRAPKGYDVLLHSIAAARAAGLRIHLAIAGDDSGILGDSLRELRGSLGLDDSVTFLGFLEDVPTFLNGIDLFVLPSLSEGFSLATVQALASSLPVVATRSGGPEEIIEEGVSGVLVEPGSVAALSEAISSMARDPVRRAALASAARRRAITAFSVEAMVRGYEGLYGAVVAR